MTALHAACEKGDKRIAEMLVSKNADMWAMASKADSNGKRQTPIEVAWGRGHKDLVQHLFGLGNASEPPTRILDSLISNGNAAQIIQLFIQQFGQTSKTDVSPLVARKNIIQHIWWRMLKRQERPRMDLLALVIKNRPKELTMESSLHFQRRAQRKSSVENKLVRLHPWICYLVLFYIQNDSDLDTRHF